MGEQTPTGRFRRLGAAVTTNRWTIVAIGLPTVAAAVLGSWNVDRPSMFGVEAISYWAAHLPVGSLAHVLRHVDIVHGTYYSLMHVVFDLLPSDTLVLRLPALVATVIATMVIGLLGHRLTGSNRIAFLAAAIFVTIPQIGQYAQTGRSYAIVTAVVAVATYLLLRCLDRPDARGRWWAYTAAMVVATYLHEFALLVLAAHLVTLLWARADRALLRRWLMYGVATVVIAVPLIAASTYQDRQVAFLHHANLASVRGLLLAYFGPDQTVAVITGVLALVAVVVAIRRPEPGVTLVRIALPILVVPAGLLLAESAVATPLFGGVRYVLYGAIGVALLVAAGIEVLLGLVLSALPRRAGAGVGALVALVAVLALLAGQEPLQRQMHSRAGFGPQDLLGVANYLHAHARPGDGVFFAPRTLYAVELGYPQRLTALTDVGQVESPARVGTLYGKDAGPRLLADRIRTQRRLWVVYHPGGQALAEIKRLIRRYHLRRVASVRFRGARIGLWVSPGGR